MRKIADMTEKERAELCDKWRTVNVDGNWWASTIDDFREHMKRRGFIIIDTYWSGFWSQGDGAYFTGYVSDTLKFTQLAGLPLKRSYQMITKLCEEHGWGSVSLEVHRDYIHHYTHEKCLRVEGSSPEFELDRDGDDLIYCVREAMNERLEAEMEDLVRESQAYLRALCRRLYRMLEQEYEYLTSDEAVWDTLLANSYALDGWN